MIIVIPMQAFHNFFVSKIDKIIIDMQESSTAFVEELIQRGYGTLEDSGKS